MAIDPKTRITRHPPKPATAATTATTARDATAATSLTASTTTTAAPTASQINAPKHPSSPSQRFFRPPAAAEPPRPPGWEKKAFILQSEVRSQNCLMMGCQLLCYRMLPADQFEIDQAQTAILYPDGRLRPDADPPLQPAALLHRLRRPHGALRARRPDPHPRARGIVDVRLPPSAAQDGPLRVARVRRL